jgi:uncharacterized membrane protein
MEFINRLIIALTETHPLHVVTVHFPIALTAVAFLFLLLALWRRSESLERAAFYNMALSPLSALVAGLTGYYDYTVRYEGDAPYINLKIFLAISLILLTIVTAASRWQQAEIVWKPATMILYLAAFAASFALAATLGFLGGAILYGF